MSETQLPRVIHEFLVASNAHDTKAMLACIADDAILVDHGREFKGIAAIKKWSNDEYIGSQVNVQVTGVNPRGNQYVVSTEINGNYPECPYFFDFSFTLHGDQILKLQI
jgi:hypothetical protein